MIFTPILAATVSLGDLVMAAFIEGGTGWTLAIAVLACALTYGLTSTRRAFSCALLGRWAARPRGAGDLVQLSQTLRLAERTWLAVGLVMLLIPWINGLAQIRGAIEDPSLVRSLVIERPAFLPVLTNILIARLLLGGKARGLAHRAVEQFESPADALGEHRDLAGDALVLAHLTIPPLWLPLMFFRFPV